VKRSKPRNEHEKELMRKYGTLNIKKIFAMIDRRTDYGPYRLSEIGIHDDDGRPSLSHWEDAHANDDMSYDEDDF
jgi:hypothetical protein